MPFPFFPGGFVLAVVVLGAALAAFGLALKAIDRAATAATTSIARGLVAGMRGWAGEHDQEVAGSPRSASPDSGAIEELPTRPSVPLRRVVRR